MTVCTASKKKCHDGQAHSDDIKFSMKTGLSIVLSNIQRGGRTTAGPPVAVHHFSDPGGIAISIMIFQILPHVSQKIGRNTKSQG